MALTSKEQILEYLQVSTLKPASESLVNWLISAVDARIKIKTRREHFEPGGVDIKAATIAFVDSDPDTITDSGNGFVTAGLASGDVISVRGSASNDGIYTIDTVAAGTITLVSTDALTAESVGNTITIRAFKEITEYHDGSGVLGYFQTDEFPITSVSSLHDDNDYPHTYASGYLIDTDDYVWYDDGTVELVTGTFNKGLKNIKIVYTAGYSEVPKDLEFLATKWTALMLKGKDRIGISSQSGADGSLTVFDQFLDADMKEILYSYRSPTY